MGKTPLRTIIPIYSRNLNNSVLSEIFQEKEPSARSFQLFDTFWQKSMEQK